MNVKRTTVTDIPGDVWYLKDRIIHWAATDEVLIDYHPRNMPCYLIHCNVETSNLDRLVGLMNDCVKLPLDARVKVYLLNDHSLLKAYESRGVEVICG